MAENEESQGVSDKEPNVQVKCRVCERALIVDGVIEANPRPVVERFRPVGGPILNAQGQQQVEVPFVCPDNNECYRAVLEEEGWTKARAQFDPMSVRPPMPQKRN